MNDAKHDTYEFLKEFNISDWLRIDILPTTALRQFGYNVTERRVISGIQQLSVILNGQLYSNYFISNYVWHIVAGHFIGFILTRWERYIF